MKTIQDEVRKGPWTEQEDSLLINFVHLFGDRRWDFIAKVSGLKVAGDKRNRYAKMKICGFVEELGFNYLPGFVIIGLNRTGKSCRLRWVNYLHPGLKRGKMTPHEEKLVLELHEKWGNRWSKIARKLPGRTDNEIKNYWRTHMRKKAQAKKRVMSPTYSPSNCSSSIITTKNPSSPFPQLGEAGFYDTGGLPQVASAEKINEATQEVEEEHPMDDIWNDLETTTIDPAYDRIIEEGCKFTCLPMASPSWRYFPDTLWKMEEEESKMFFPFEYEMAYLTG